MIHNSSPVRFGAILIKGDQLEKLKHAYSVGAPDFTRPYSMAEHTRNNGSIAGALRNSTKNPDIYIGGNWTGGQAKTLDDITEANRKPGYEDAVILRTRADGPGGSIMARGPLAKYNPDHNDEVVLSHALDKAGIEYDRASWEDIYQEAYGVDYNKFFGIKK